MSKALQIVTINVNGIDRQKAIDSAMTLLQFLREEINLTGTKKGCDLGECGCCSVLINGKPMLSCLTLAMEVAGEAVITIEGIADGPQLHPVQEAMVEAGAIQCGFCTPGMVINGVELIENNPNPSDDEIKRCVSATICRCTGYTKIEKAMKNAVKNSTGVEYYKRTVPANSVPANSVSDTAKKQNVAEDLA